jgi:SPFH domain / Band 7 family
MVMPSNAGASTSFFFFVIVVGDVAMNFGRTFGIKLHQVGLLLEDGVPSQRLAPGTYSFPFWKTVEVIVFDTTTPIADMPADALSLLKQDLLVADIAQDERGILSEHGAAVRRLGPGRHHCWLVKGPTVERVNASSIEVHSASMSVAVRTLLKEDIVTFDVGEDERVLLLEDNIATRVLPAGRHVFFALKGLAVVRYDTKGMVVELPPAHATLFAAHTTTLNVSPLERGVIVKKRKPVRVVGPGVHTLWLLPDVAATTIDVAGTVTPPLDADLKPLMPATDYTEVTVPEGAVGVRFVNGAIDEILAPGRHAAFTVEKQVSIVSLDVRERVVQVQGQEILTKDKVSLRLNASMTYRIDDPRKLITRAKNADEILYLAVQLGLREQVAGHTLDEILADRSLLAEQVRPAAMVRAEELGLVLLEFGVKDIILPGEMKTLLNKVIEAQKTAEANVITRREETAAVRSMAQTAKVLGESPILMRLKELETYKELADKVGTVHVVIGHDGMPKLDLRST